MAGSRATPPIGGVGWLGPHPGWPAELGPVQLAVGEVTLRPLARGDGGAWSRQRRSDRAGLEPWEVGSALSWDDRHSAGQWRLHRSSLNRAAKQGETLPFAITVAGRFAGQATLGGIHRGPLGSGWIGYWVDPAVQRRGVATVAVALAVGHALGPAGLHRVEATIAPENAASLAVVDHLGFRREGLLRRYLSVGDGWHDHLLFALTVEDVPGGTAELLARCTL